MKLPEKSAILKAAQTIKSYVHRTPIQTSKYINNLKNADVYFKCENFQKTGSFKVRGACNTLLNLQGKDTICTSSTGNHGLGTAFMAGVLGIKSYILVPEDTPDVKINALSGYGATVLPRGRNMSEMGQAIKQTIKQKGAHYINSQEEIRIVEGAATVSKQIYEEIQDLDYIILPIGTGGHISGTLLSTMYFSPKTTVIGVQPRLAADAYESLLKGQRQPSFPPKTIAEGVKPNLGNLTFSILNQLGKKENIIQVEEEEILDATRILHERMKLVTEFSGALGLAGFLKDPRFVGKKVAITITGGNINLSQFFDIYREKIKENK